MRDWWKLMGVALLLATAARGQSRSEIFSDVPAPFCHHHLTYSKKPVYFECMTNGLAIYPGNVKVQMSELAHPGMKLKHILDDLRNNADKKFLVVAQRPAAGMTERVVYQVIAGLPVEVGIEVLDASTPLEEAVKQPDFVLASLARPAKGMRRAVFECRGGRICFVDHDLICTRVKKFVDARRPLSRVEDIRELERELQSVKFGDENYSAHVEDLLTGRVSLEVRPEWRGDSVDDLKTDGSRFRRKLGELEKEGYVVLFILREDSLDVCRQARALAEKAGYRWSARYFNAGEELTFYTEERPNSEAATPSWW